MAETSGVVWEGAEGGRSGGSTRFLPPTDVAAARPRFASLSAFSLPT